MRDASASLHAWNPTCWSRQAVFLLESLHPPAPVHMIKYKGLKEGGGAVGICGIPALPVAGVCLIVAY